MIFLAFVVPLAIYLLILAYLNRRRHPTVMPGTWDFVGVLFGASGFILLGGPAILTGLYEHWRLSWLLGDTHYLQGLGENWSFWVSLWVVYFAVVVVVATIALWRRRCLTSIYNVEPTVFEDVLAQVLDRQGFEWLRQTSQRILIKTRGLSNSAQWVALDLDPFQAMRHVSLRWGQDADALRVEVERELSRILAEVPSGPNPIGGWFFSLGVGLFLVTFFGVFAFLLLKVLQSLR